LVTGLQFKIIVLKFLCSFAVLSPSSFSKEKTLKEDSDPQTHSESEVEWRVECSKPEHSPIDPVAVKNDCGVVIRYECRQCLEENYTPPEEVSDIYAKTENDYST